MSIEPRAKLQLVRPAIERTQPYVPAETVEVLARRSGRPVDQLVKLDANENLYGPSPRVRAVLGEYAHYHIYPDPDQVETRAAVAQYLGVPMEHVLMGAGSDELIHLLTVVYLDPGDEVIDFTPSFAMYPIYSGMMNARMVEVPRDAAFQLDPEAGLRAVTERTKLIFVANPNNPTGTGTPRAAILRLLESGRIVVVDEAYAEFASHTMVHDVRDYENLVVLRSFSKWAGLAGLRAGCVVAQESVLQYLWKVKSPFNFNTAAGLAVRAALADVAYLHDCVRRVVAERERLAAALREFDFLRVYPSEGNFLYVEVTRGGAHALRERLVEQGISVRHFGGPPRIVQGLRITVGKPEHTDALVAALRALQW
ncbi:MAG TPA: histidinol-phosphate transaminase [Chloroflexota bacterium]|nr:histidinol-phosphate transaminase [Chloroflexota bacterium]